MFVATVNLFDPSCILYVIIQVTTFLVMISRRNYWNSKILKRAVYILMDMIVPPTQETVVVTHDKHRHIQVTNELGIYGVFVKPYLK